MSKTYTLENYLVDLHTGGWFGWSNSNNKVYANLIIHPKVSNELGEMINNPHTKPSESDCTAGVAAMQADWDGKEYARKRKTKYDALNQFELISDDATNGTTTHKDAIAAIKAAHPKP